LTKLIKEYIVEEIMEVVKSIDAGVVTLRLSGRLSAATAEKFEVEFQEAIQEAEKGVVLDLKDLTYLASSGLRVFVSARKRLTQEGKSLTLIHLRDDVREVLSLTGLDEFFVIRE